MSGQRMDAVLSGRRGWTFGVDGVLSTFVGETKMSE